jgi:protein-tyrosine-phosphatase
VTLHPADPADPADADVLGRATDELAARYHGIFSSESVRALVDESYQLLAENAHIHRYLPILAARFAADRLSAAAKAEGLSQDPNPEVLFVCVHNAGRSQMAAGLLTNRSGGAVTARSAGSRPAPGLDPVVIQALREIGIDPADAYPKPLTDEVVKAADAVVTMGCGDACPIYPGKRYLDWHLPDPEGLTLPEVRVIRDQIDARVSALLTEVTPTRVA